MPELHVVFGSGALGSALVGELVAKGHSVRVASRSGKKPSDAPPSVEATKADLSVEKDAIAACQGATAIYFVASPPYTEWPALFPPMYRGVMAAAGATGARLVSCENVYPYGRVTTTMTEDTPMNPCSKKGALRAEWNERLLAAHAKGEVKAALVRGPDYYGPGAGVTTLYGDEVFGRAIAGKKANILGDIDALHTWTCARDFARSMAAVGSVDDAMGQTWHAVSPTALTQRAFLEVMFREIGAPLRAQALPKAMLAILALFVPVMRELKEMNYQWEGTYDFRSDKIQARFGLKPTSHEVAIAETVAWFRGRAPPAG